MFFRFRPVEQRFPRMRTPQYADGVVNLFAVIECVETRALKAIFIWDGICGMPQLRKEIIGPGQEDMSFYGATLHLLFCMGQLIVRMHATRSAYWVAKLPGDGTVCLRVHVSGSCTVIFVLSALHLFVEITSRKSRKKMEWFDAPIRFAALLCRGWSSPFFAQMLVLIVEEMKRLLPCILFAEPYNFLYGCFFGAM